VVYYGEQTKTIGGWDAWIGPSRLLVTWLSVPFDGQRIHEAYVLNLENGAVEQLPGYQVHMNAYAWEDGSRVALLDLGNDEHHSRILLSDLESGQVTTIYDADPQIEQWAGAELHPQGSGFSFESGNVTWLSRDVFVVEMSPGFKQQDMGQIYYWGDTLLIVDLTSKSTHLLPRGFLAGALYDGTILLSQDSADGEDLNAFQPPYTSAPTLISDPGVWISSIDVSPNGKRVLWLESQPKSEDLARQHEICFEGCGFRATPKNIVVWDRDSGQVKRTPLANYGWERDGLGQNGAYVSWSKDDTSILCQVLVDDKNVGLFRLTPDGNADLLIKQVGGPMMYSGPGDYVTGISLIDEANDGSIYYSPPDTSYSLMLRRPDGTTELLTRPESNEQNHPNPWNFLTWTFDGRGHLLILDDDGVTVTDTGSGEKRRVAFDTKDVLKDVFSPFETVRVSPNGEWVAYSGWDHNQFLSLEGLPDHGLVLRVAKAK
jgi:hypothetical protein